MNRPLPDEWSREEKANLKALSLALAAWRKEMHDSCPSCERAREIISSLINAAQCNQKWEVLDALKEIQEALKIP